MRFFDNLSESNQLLHTTHSPFLVDVDRVDRARVVYVDDRGKNAASADLRATERNRPQTNSVYAVHAALGLSVSETLLQGCHPVIVEGPSDQIDLGAIKSVLIGLGRITPSREIIFVPAGGVRGINAVASIISSKEEGMPVVLLDSDEPGRELKKRLLSGLYQGSTNKVVEVADAVDMPNAETEDLFPYKILDQSIQKLFKDVEAEAFGDVLDERQAIVPQISKFAEKHGVSLPVVFS